MQCLSADIPSVDYTNITVTSEVLCGARGKDVQGISKVVFVVNSLARMGDCKSAETVAAFLGINCTSVES